jgi:hypothetical protein
VVAPKLQPFEIRELPDSGGGVILQLWANGLRIATARANADAIRDMGIGRDKVLALLSDRLSNLQLRPELDGQVFGYWFGPDDSIPDAPVGSPTGAVLPRPAASIGALELTCLDLVPVHNWWLVLSELGRYTYRHTAGLLNGEDGWRFVPVKNAAAGAWPLVYSVEFAESMPADTIEAAYGFEASTRARLDAPAVQLRLRLLPQP